MTLGWAIVILAIVIVWVVCKSADYIKETIQEQTEKQEELFLETKEELQETIQEQVQEIQNKFIEVVRTRHLEGITQKDLNESCNSVVEDSDGCSIISGIEIGFKDIGEKTFYYDHNSNSNIFLTEDETMMIIRNEDGNWEIREKLFQRPV